MSGRSRWAAKRAIVVVVLCCVLVGAMCAQAPSGQTAPPAGAAPVAPVQAPPAPLAAPETQALHVQVGRSVVINLQARLRRVLVSNHAVLDTVTVTPTQLVVTSKAPGSSSLVIWDEAGQTRILDVYADLDVSGLRDSIRQAFPTEPIQVEADQSRILLSGNVSSKTVQDEVLKLASVFSKEVLNSFTVRPTPRGRQVMLKVRFAEVDRTKLDAFGINILSTGAANTPGIISTQQFGPPTLGGGKIDGVIGGALKGTTTSLSASDLLNLFVFRPDLNLGATIKALQQKSVLQILAEPNLMCRSGEQARFLAGGEFPVPIVQGGANVGAVTIQFRPFGVRLDFVANVGDDDVVRLKVAPEVSTLDFANALTISGFTVPAISTRRAETEVDLRDGQSFGIAGLLDQRTTQQLSRIPGIGDVPILGNLFRSRQTSRSNTELLVLVTPIIVDPLSSTTAPPPGPVMPVPNLDQKKFDGGVSPRKPAAPPSK